MNKRQVRIERIVRVEREYRAASSALALLEDRLRADPSWGETHGWRRRDASSLADHIEPTYIIRVYAEFESGLRDLWKNYFRKRTHPPMMDLLRTIAARQTVPQDDLDDADEVRRFRNSLVHEGIEEDVTVLTLPEVKSRLCRYFSRMPLDW